MTGRIPWSRVFIEGVVIVFSILLAFAIDAWWAGVGDRKQEQLALAGLETDFEGYLEELARVRELNETRAESARTLVKLAGPDPAEIDAARFQDLLGRVLVYTPIILPAGTLGSLQETGGLALISDPTLRVELVAWTRSVDFSREMTAYLAKQSRELDAFLKPRYPMAPILRRILVSSEILSADEPVIETAFPADAMTLLKAQEFANHVAYAEGASSNLINSIDSWSEQAEQILSLIRKSSSED